MRRALLTAGRLLIAVLVVTSMFAGYVPLGDSGPRSGIAAVQDGGAGECNFGEIVIGTDLESNGDCTVLNGYRGSVEEDGTDNQLKTDLHTQLVTARDSRDQKITSYENLVSDLETVTSLEARAAVADAYRNGKSAQEARQAALEAIENSTVKRQEFLIKFFESDAALLRYTANVSGERLSPQDDLAYLVTDDSGPSGVSYDATTYDEWLPANQSPTANVTLVDGTNRTVDAFSVRFNATNTANPNDNVYGTQVVTVTPDKQYPGYKQEPTSTTWDSPAYFNFTKIQVREPYQESPLTGQRVYTHQDYYEAWNETKTTYYNVTNRFNQSTVDALYQSFNNGEIDPENVVPPEERVDEFPNASTDYEAYRAALAATLGAAHPDYSNFSKMEIDFTGETYRTFNTTTDSYERVTVENETYTGYVLMDGQPPNGSLQVGQTYDVSNLPDDVRVLRQTDTERQVIPLHSGNMTVLNATDSTGSPVDSVGYDGGTDWQTLDDPNSFKEYLDTAEEAQADIDIRFNTAGGGGGGFSLPSVDLGGLQVPGTAVLIIIGVVALLLIDD